MPNALWSQKLEQGGGAGLAILIRRASQEGLQRPEKNFNASFFKTLLLDANLSPPQRKSGDARKLFQCPDFCGLLPAGPS